MSTTRTCPQCQQPLPVDAPEGLCPACVMQNLAASAASLPTEIPPRKSGPAEAFIDIANPLEVAERLPQFEIGELLGRGGMGVVFKAVQRQIDRTVALKILPPGDASSPDFVERFRREARSLAKLSHPNIVTLYEFGESGGLYYFVMEYVDGANLREMIRSGKMKAEEALAVVPKICDALQFAHEEGVVHRDIKPENILVDKRGRVKIADFGLAKLLRREQSDQTLTMTGMTLGTPRYMAPEQLDKPESVDHRADIYSLGVVFYEMLTGELPMGRFAPPSQKVQIDVRLDEIVLHALERDVKLRYQHASEVKTDVENVTNKPWVAPVAQAAASGAPEGTAVLLLDETDVSTRRHQHTFEIGGFVWVIIGVGGAVIVCALHQYGFLPLPIGFLVMGVSLMVLAGRVRQQWEIDYLGHSVRFENSVYTSGKLMIDGKIMASGGIGPRTELSARIPNGPGAGDRIVVKTHAQMRSFQCQLFAEPKAPAPAVGIKREIEKVTGGVAGEAANVEPVQITPLPRFFKTRSFVALMLGWFAFAALWNHGVTGFALGVVIMAAIVKEIGRTYANRNPLWVEQLRARPPWKRFSMLFLGLLELVVILTMFVSGLFMLWDSTDTLTNQSAAKSEAFEAKYKGKEYQLIRQLDAFRGQVPPVEMVKDFLGGSVGSTVPKPIVWVFVIGGPLFLFAFFKMSAREQAHLAGPRRGGWRAAFSCTQIFLLSLVVGTYALSTGLFIFQTYGTTTTERDVEQFVVVRANVNQVSNALHRWAAENGCDSGSDRWSLQTVPRGEVVAHAEIFSAWKESPFERWRMTASGMERPFPYFEVQIEGSEKPAQSDVWIRSGGFLSSLVLVGSETEKQWQAIIKSLSDAVSKAPEFDPTKMGIVKPEVKHVETGSEWPGLCAVLGAMILWIFVIIRYLTPVPADWTSARRSSPHASA